MPITDRFRPTLLTAALVGLLPTAALLADGDRPRVEREPADRVEARDGRPGQLGVEIVDLTPELAEHLGAPDGGVLVGRVEASGAADRAGLRVGDVLTEIAGRRVDSGRDLARELSFYDAGEAVGLTAVRDGRTLALETTLDAGSRRGTRIYAPSHRRGHDIEIDVDVEEMLADLADLGVVIGHEVGVALSSVDWEEIGEAIEDGLGELEELEDLEIELRRMDRDIEIEIEEGLRELERELERELSHVERRRKV